MAVEYNGHDYYKLSSGKLIYANHGILGLSSECNLYEGYDGSFLHESWSREDRVEVAEMMIERWKKWAAPDDPNIRIVGGE